MKYKYHNKKITKDGETFDSVKEYNRWCELKLLERAGLITGLKRQVKFELIPAQREKVWNKKKNCFELGKVVERECAYYADFVYRGMDTCRIVVEDVKSPATRTKDYVIKRKLMLYYHKIKIREV